MSPIILIVAFAQIFVLLILNVNRKDKEIVILTFIGMFIGLIINIIFIPHYAERATAFSQLLVEFLVTTFSFFLAKRVLNFQFPIKLFLLNIIFVFPFAFITYVCLKATNNVILELLFSGILCGIYFLFYQLVFIKDKILLELIEPYFKKFRKSN